MLRHRYDFITWSWSWSTFATVKLNIKNRIPHIKNRSNQWLDQFNNSPLWRENSILYSKTNRSFVWVPTSICVEVAPFRSKTTTRAVSYDNAAFSFLKKIWKDPNSIILDEAWSFPSVSLPLFPPRWASKKIFVFSFFGRFVAFVSAIVVPGIYILSIKSL